MLNIRFLKENLLLTDYFLFDNIRINGMNYVSELHLEFKKNIC